MFSVLGGPGFWAVKRAGIAIEECWCYRTERVHPLALAEPNTTHQELQWRKIVCFIMNGAIQENGKLMLTG